jgi:hypothetical protein
MLLAAMLLAVSDSGNERNGNQNRQELQNFALLLGLSLPAVASTVRF